MISQRACGVWPCVIVAAAAMQLAATASADVVTTIATPSASVKAGAQVTLTLYLVNTGTDSAKADAPAELLATFISGPRRELVHLARQQKPLISEVIPPHGFLEVPYELKVPSGFAGTTVVELAMAGSPRTALMVDSGDAAIATAPPTRPAETVAPGGAVAAIPPGEELIPNKPAVPEGDSGIGETILTRFSAHEPVYFIAGGSRPNVKFQVSFKYQLLNPDGPLAKDVPALAGFNVAYSQTSLWDVEGESAPFRDSSYRPELLWSAPDIRFDKGLVSRIGLQAGIGHESNGKAGADSRSMNVAFIRPSITFGDTNGLFLTFAPKLQTYIFSLSDNPDIKDYRGYGELKLIGGDRDGLQLAATARIGDDWDKGSIELDVSYPLRKLLGGNVDLYLYGQYFNGFGESLLDYNQSTSQFRIGLALVR